MLHAIILDMSARVLVDVEGIDNTEGKFVGLTLPCEATWFLYRDDLRVRVKLVEEEDKEGLEELGMRLHGVEIPLELAGEGLAIAMEGTGAAKEDWADLIGGVADECRKALHGGEGSGSDSDSGSDSEDWHDAGMSLGACLDASGNGNGELQVAEIEGLVDALAAEGIISQETHAAIKEQKPEDGDMVVSHEDAAGVVEA